MDSQQDWNLVAGREDKGWTIMAFNRALQTGDTRDRDIVEVSVHMQLLTQTIKTLEYLCTDYTAFLTLMVYSI